MSSLQPLLAFFSSAHSDELDEERLARSRQLLQDEIRACTGLDVQMFGDTANLCQGDHWQDAIRSASAGSLFLVPVVTPGYFRSESCRAVYEAFSQSQGKQLSILPIYYSEAYELEYSAWRSEHQWAQGIADCLWVDFRALRSQPLESAELQSCVRSMALGFKQRLLALGASTPPRPMGAAPRAALARRSVAPGRLGTPPSSPPFDATSGASVDSGRIVIAPLTKLSVDAGKPLVAPAPSSPPARPPSLQPPPCEESVFVPAKTRFNYLPGALVVIAALAGASIELSRTKELAPATAAMPLVPYETRSVSLPPGLRTRGFSRNGEWLAADGDGKLVLFEVSRPDRAPRIIAEQASGGEPISAVAISPTGAMVAAVHGARAILHDLKSGTNDELPHGGLLGPVRLCEFSPDGGLLALAGRDGGVTLVSLPELLERQRIPAEGASDVAALAFDAKSQRLAVASKELGRVAVYDLQAAPIQTTTLLRRSDPFLPQTVAFSPDGSSLASGDALSGNVQIWDLATSTVAREYRAAEGAVESLSFDLEGTRLASLAEEGALRVWNSSTQSSDIWLPRAVPDSFAAVFLGNTLYTSAAVTNEPGLLLWVHDRLGAERGVGCRLIGSTSVQQVSDQHGACLFSRISPGKYRVSAGRTEDRGVEVHAPLVLSVSTSGG